MARGEAATARTCAAFALGSTKLGWKKQCLRDTYVSESESRRLIKLFLFIQGKSCVIRGPPKTV